MSSFNTSKINGDSLAASEWNQLEGLNQVILSTGEIPSDADLQQLAKAMAAYASSTYFIDTGSANAYNLTSSGSFLTPNAYFEGMRIEFYPANANTGASTVQVGSLGLVDLKKEDGNDLQAGDLILGRKARFTYIAGEFRNEIIGSDATTTTRGIGALESPCLVSNNATDPSNDIDISAGNFTFDDGSGQGFIVSALTKRLDASWVEGTNQGGLDTGTKQANTDYFIYQITNLITGVSDIIMTASFGSPTMPAGYTKKKYLASFITDGSANIVKASYYLKNCLVIYDSKVSELSNYNNSPGTYPITIAAPINCVAILDAEVTTNEDLNSVFSSYIATNDGFRLNNDWASGSWSGGYNNRTILLRLDSSNRIKLTISYQSGTGGINLTCNGYIDVNIKS